MHNTLTHITYKIKLQFLTVCLFFCSVVSVAQVKYWVGGTGNWNDNQHWAQSSGGVGGFAIPTLQDTVIIDDLSLDKDLSIDFSGKIFCKTILIKTAKNLYFSSDNRTSIYIAQTFNFPKNERIYKCTITSNFFK